MRLLFSGLEVVVGGAAVEVDDDVAADVEGAPSTGSLTAGAGGSRDAAGECWALERVRAIFVRRGVVEANLQFLFSRDTHDDRQHLNQGLDNYRLSQRVHREAIPVSSCRTIGTLFHD